MRDMHLLAMVVRWVELRVHVLPAVTSRHRTVEPEQKQWPLVVRSSVFHPML